MLQPYATHTVIFRMFFFSSNSGYFRVIIGTSTLSESPISVLFHEGMASSTMTSQREESGEVSDALFSDRKTSRQFDYGL